MKKKRIYVIDLLPQIANRDKCEIIGDYPKCSYKTSVEYKCQCGNINKKTFKLMKRAGAICKNCMKEKLKHQNIELYGVDHPLKANEIREKIKQTNKNRYGCEEPLKCKEIRDKLKQTNKKRYGCECAAGSPIVRKKMETTFLNRYGVTTPGDIEEVKIKRKATNLRLYNVEELFQCKKIQDKIKNTCLQKYGSKLIGGSPQIREKIMDTCFKRYGCAYIFGVKIFQEKIRNTFMNLYGCKYPMQNSEILEKQQKSAFKHKPFTFPTGETVKVQGYEPIALKCLVDNNYTFTDLQIGVKNVPKIQYMLDKLRFYYCDIYIPKENKIIEVKSTWTFYLDHDKVIAKAKACVEQGYNYEFYIINDKFEINIKRYPHDFNIIN